MNGPKYVPARLVNNVTQPPPLPEITKRSIVCGVVEGFYGRPWTQEQRKHLFARLKRLGMNTYLYAPKDDLKHRAEWRLLYTHDETEILQDLIASAKEHDINFVYAISPGLDIVYSQQKEVDCLKEKLEQVRSLGCCSFAILFDDIEHDMQEQDKQRYFSFAAAQVAVTNQIYEYLGAPEFYFCPTEYCETRSKPSLLESEYLRTIGKRLNSLIHVLWTGPRVISRVLTVEGVRQVASVLRRKPLIWDNLHANDYDPKRVFMGPFAGRSVSLKDEIAGLLLNPNCKYEANFVPFHTLSDWNACDADAPQVIEGSDATLEAGGSSPVACLAVDSAKPVNFYHPLHSLRNAIGLWIDEFNSDSGPGIPPVRRVEDDMLDSKICETQSNDADTSSQEQTILLEEIIQAVVQPPVDEERPINSFCADYVEPMDTRPFVTEVTEHASEPVVDLSNEVEVVMESEERLTDYEQVATLVDMFFLPFECGRRAADVLEQFAWLFENSHVMSDDSVPQYVLQITQAEWRRRCSSMTDIISNLRNIFRFITDCQNKPLVSELIPYAWEAHGCCSVLLGITRWLEAGMMQCSPEEQPRFWNVPIEEEPWTIGGGFVSNVYRLISAGSEVIELFYNKGLLPLSIVDYSISPLNINELARLSTLATTNSSRTQEQNELNHRLFFDKYINHFINADSKYLFIVENESFTSSAKIMCCGSAVKDGRKLKETLSDYVTSLENEYIGLRVDGVNMEALRDEVASWFPCIPCEVFDLYPSWIDVRFNVDAYEAVPAKKLIHTMMGALSMNGSSGAFLAVPLEEEDRIQFFLRIGFLEIRHTEDGKFVVLGHRLMVRTDKHNSEV